MNIEKNKNNIFILLGCLSISYIGFMLYKNINSIDNLTYYISLVNLIIALIPGVLMTLSNSYLNTFIIEDIDDIRIKKKFNFMLIYSYSQIFRYLPGKIFGVVYQGEKLSNDFSRKTTWFANFIQMAITSANSIIVLGTMYLYISGYTFGSIVYLTCTISFLFITIKNNIIYMIINYFLGEKYKHSPTKTLPVNRVLLQIIFLQLDWLFYFSIWFLLIPPQLPETGFVLIGAIYAAASLLGALAFIMPSGLLIREASFIWLGGIVGLSQSVLIVYSVIARMFFILADLTWALILTIISTIKKEVFQ